MASGPSAAVLHQRPSFKSEQILLEKTAKVKQAPWPEIVAARHDAATRNSLQSGHLQLLEDRERLRADSLKKQNILSVPPLFKQSGLPAYVRRLEREAAALAPATVGDAPAAAAGAGVQGLGNNTESHSTFRVLGTAETLINTGSLAFGQRGESRCFLVNVNDHRHFQCLYL